MKIVFSSRPAYGHVYPLLPLAGAARRAGHHVSFATTGHFLARLDRLGYPTHDVGLTIEDAHATAPRVTVGGRDAEGWPTVDPISRWAAGCSST